jgi:uncharacterized membrane protein
MNAVRFVRTVSVFAGALTLCGLQMQAQQLSRKDWVDLAKARAGRQASPQAAASSPKADGTFITVDVPNSCATTLEGINSRGDIIGGYVDCSFQGHNFVLSNSVFTDVDPPGCFGDSGFLSTEMGINQRGDVVGTCIDSNGFHGFLLSKGVYSKIDAPGASPVAVGTIASGINPSGDIVGWYTDNAGLSHGYLLRKGAYTNIDVPGSLGAAPGSTVALAINPQGEILGQYSNTSGTTHGFLLSHGTFTMVPDVPALGSITFPLGLNPQGDIVGAAFVSPCCGFLITNSTVTLVNVPGSPEAIPYGINPQGDIVGTYFDTSGNQHGFLLPKN